MPYLGNELATQFQAFVTQTITGDGSTGYTLDRAVANGKELLVYINNVKQEEGSGKAYTASGTTITFSEAVASGDSCYVVFLGSAVQTVVPPDASIVSSMFSTADLSLTGALTITLDDNSENLKLVTTDADASVGPTLRMDRQSASAADSDLLGKINFVGHNDAGTPEDIGYAGITAIISDASDGTEDGKLAINTMVAGTERSRIFVDAGETVFNEDSIDVDFRVESNNNANALFVDAGTGDGVVICGSNTVVGRFGAPLEVTTHGGTNRGGVQISNFQAAATDSIIDFNKSRNNTVGSHTVVQSGDNIGSLVFRGSDGSAFVDAAAIGCQVDGTPGSNDMPGRLVFFTTPDGASGGTERFRIANNGDLTATDTSIGSNSDERLKKNIADFTYDLEKFKQYKPKTFDWKNPSAHNGKTGNRGFLAQDVKSVDDKWVGEIDIPEGNLDYDIISDNVSLTSKLGDKDAMYISVIQQLITKVETLEAEVAKLKG